MKVTKPTKNKVLSQFNSRLDCNSREITMTIDQKIACLKDIWTFSTLVLILVKISLNK